MHRTETTRRPARTSTSCDEFICDRSQEEVDLGKERFRVLCRLTPPHLARSNRPPLPEATDVTYMSWPVLLAAAAVRLQTFWRMSPDLIDEPGAEKSAEITTDAGAASALVPSSPLQSAVSALLSCAPSDALTAYNKLSPTEKASLLVMLVDGACDTPHVSKVNSSDLARPLTCCERLPTVAGSQRDQ